MNRSTRSRSGVYGNDDDNVHLDPAEEEATAIEGNEEDEFELDHAAANDAQEDELYAILNLPRTATQEQIVKRYKQLAALLHPDRHPTPSLKHAADSRFQAISRAHEILSDPTSRTIYDAVGIEGLKTKWEVGPKHQTPQELREQFERLGRAQRENDLEVLVRSRGELICTLDARVLFLSASEREALGGPPIMTLNHKVQSVTTKQLVLKHSFTVPIDQRTNLTLTGQLLSREGVGAGNLFARLICRPSAKWSIDIGTTVLRPRALTFKTTFAPDPDSFVIFDLPIKTLSGPPPLSLTFGRRVTSAATCNFTFRSGLYSLGSWGLSSSQSRTGALLPESTVSLGLIHNSGLSIDATSGAEEGQVSGSYQVAVLGSVSCNVGGAFSSYGGVSAFVGAERKVGSEGRVRVGGTLEIGMNQRMTFKLKISRLGQKIVLPIIISTTLNPTLVVGFTCIPALSMMVTHYYVIIPRRKKRVAARIVQLRSDNEAFIAEKQKEAEEAISLLVDHVAKRKEIELASNGLIILEATYGVLDPSSSSSSSNSSRTIDVTIPLQALVSSPHPQVSIPSGRTKASLLGFYDCALSEKKRLRIRYLFKGREHMMEVGDREGVALPLRAHLLD